MIKTAMHHGEEIQQQEQKNSNRIDRKLRQKIEEKKQAQGLKMG